MRISTCEPLLPPAVDALETGLTHESGDALAAYAPPLLHEILMDPRPSVRSVGARVILLDPLQENLILAGSLRQGALAPRVVAAA